MAGTIGGARWSGVGARNSLILAVLMNTRGLTELIVLNVGLQLGILDTQIYSLMVAMAIVTTAIAGPALSVFYPRGRIVLDRQDAAIALGTVATRLES
jgi:Kef-type K+ transport system membrane component KefB